MATTASPATSAFELPKVTAGRPFAPLMRMSATSSMGLVPTNVAGSLFVDPLRVTVMVPPPTAAAMT